MADLDAGLTAHVDQMEAAASLARRLAPHNRQFFDDPRLRDAMTLALGRLPDSADLDGFGLVPVLCWRGDSGDDSTIYERHGTQPITSTRPIEWCSSCRDSISSSALVPFWVARGELIVQLDLCSPCATERIFAGAVPQVGS